MQLLTAQQVPFAPKFTGKEISSLLDISVQSTTKAIRDMLDGLVRDWLADDMRTLMLLLLFEEQGDRMYPPDNGQIPAAAHRYLKAGRLMRSNRAAFFGMLARAVTAARTTR